MTRRYVVVAAALAALLGLHSGQAAFSSSAAEQNNTPPDQTEIPIVVQLPYGLPFNSVELNDPGEVQSTVIPPGKKTQCPSGCLLISNDNDKDPGRIVSFALDKLGGLPVIATIDPELGPDRMIKSNDHDLITLKNGDVLYLRMGRTKAPLPPEAVWFDHAWKIPSAQEPDGFGPGARSEIFVWRSVDGGGSFQFLSGIDTALVDDDFGTATDYSGGMPQLPGSTDPPGIPEQPVWQMGGTDGPLARVDPVTARVFVVLGLVGYRQNTFRSYFALSDEKLKRSLVLMSADNGESWERVGTLGHGGWRTDIVPRAADQLAFAAFAWNDQTLEGHSFVSTATIGQFPVPDVDPLMDSVQAPEKQGPWGWSTIPNNHPILGNSMYANFAGQTNLVRSPSSNKLVLAFMDTLENDKGDGYRVYLFDGNDSWAALPPIAPLSPNKNNFILHLTAIDPGEGPILLYWYDVNTVTGEASIRARVITSDISYTSDFAIAESFSVLTPKWYGDYHTAGGYAVSRLGTYNFYPVWVQPDGRVHFTHVQYTTITKPGRLPEPQMVGPVQLIQGFFVRPEDTTIQRQTIDVSRLITIDTEEEAIREDTRVPPR